MKKVNAIPRYVVYGTGLRSKKAIEFLDLENISCFIDEKETEKEYEGRSVYRLGEYMNLPEREHGLIIISLRDCQCIEERLRSIGVNDYVRLEDILY